MIALVRITCLIAVALVPMSGCDRLRSLIGDEPAEPAADTPASAASTDPAAAAAPDEDKAADPETATDNAAPSDPDPAAVDGPHVRWQTSFTSVPRALSIGADGTLVAVFDDRIKGFLDGAQTWEIEGELTDLARLQDGTIALARGAELVVLDPTTGAQKFAAEMPPNPDAEGRRGRKSKAGPAAAPSIVATAPFGSQIMLALSDARFQVVDPPTCEAGKPACLRPSGELEGEYLEPKTMLTVADDGTRFLVEDDAMRAFDLALAELFSVSAASRITGAVPVPNGRVAIAYDGAVVLLDVGACEGRSPLLGRNGAGPKGCVLWRYHADLEPFTPAVIDEATLAANGKLRLQAIADGTDSWKSPIGAFGPVITDGKSLYTMCAEGIDGAVQLSVKAVAVDMGTVTWSVALPFSVDSGESIAIANVRFDHQDSFIAAGLSEHTAVIEIPRD